MTGFDAADLFGGPGGWAEACRILGLSEVGLEWDDTACRTRVAAGHPVIRTDVAAYPTAPFRGRIRGLIASAPCQAWSRAGLRLGIADQPLVHQAVADLAKGRDTRAGLLAACRDARSLLAAEPMRWLHGLRPEWAVMEEVPDVLPLFQQYAQVLREWGYSAWCGILNAADYGVPQTRRRAILIASRVRDAAPPEPTHAEDPGEGMLFGPARERWVSMAQALGWGATDRPVPTVTAGGGKTGGAEPFPTQARAALERSRDAGDWAARSGQWTVDVKAGGYQRGYERSLERPAPTLMGQAYKWVLRSGQSVAGEGRAERDLDEPAVTITGRADLCEWAAHRPATTVAGTGRIAKPGHRDRKGGERQFEDSVRISVQEAAVLQSFRPDYPWQGTKTKQFECVGNAVPPRLAAAVLGAAAGLDWAAAVEREYNPDRLAERSAA